MLSSRRLLTAALAVAALAAGVLAVAGALALGSRAGLSLTVTDATGAVVLARPWPDADLRALAPLLPEQRPLRARLSGLWHLAAPGRMRFSLRSEAAARVTLDGRLVVERAAEARAAGREAEVALPGGPMPLELVADIEAAASAVRLRVAGEGQAWRGLDPFDLYPEALDMMGAGRRGAARWLRGAAAICLSLAAGLVLAAAVQARRDAGAWPGWAQSCALPLALVALAALLRLHAMVGRQWHAEAPMWARETAAALSAVVPAFAPEPRPWNGDPYSYLLAAREGARGFYDGHVREPLFVFLVRSMLWLAGGQDAAVQLASLVASALIPGALVLLGAALGSTAAGALAGLLWALERQAIALSVEGWRDDLFALLAVVFATAVVRAWPRAGTGSGLGLGVAGALAALTRITSLSFVLPALLLLALRRETRRAAGVAAATCALLVAPYLFDCWRTLGDPLVSINAHTGYYRGAAGLGAGAMSVGRYLAAARPPFESLDVALYGLLVNPFARQWQGFGWLPVDPGPLLALCSGAGILLLLATARGRVVLGLALCAVAPFAFTWDLPGGGEWRFTLVAYPFLLLAAALALALAWPAARAARGELVAQCAVRGVALVLAGAVALATALVALPWARAREAVGLGRPVTVASGPRDLCFTAFGGWSLPRRQGAIDVRDCPRECSLRIPRAATGQRLRLRVAPANSASTSLQATLDGVALAPAELQPAGERMGEVALDLRASSPGRASSLSLRADGGFTVWYWTLTADPGVD